MSGKVDAYLVEFSDVSASDFHCGRLLGHRYMIVDHNVLCPVFVVVSSLVLFISVLDADAFMA